MAVVTPKFRVSYPSVFKAKVNNLSGKEEFGVTALFDKGADLTTLKDAAQRACEDKWGTDQTKWPKNLRTPFRDQADKMKDGMLPPGHTEGAIFMNLKSKNRPGVVDENVQAILDETQFYAGCYAKASISAYAYDQAGNKGVNFGLGNIQKVAEGEPLGGRTTPEMDFKPIEGAATTTDSTSMFT